MNDAVDLVSKSLCSCLPSLPRNSAWRTVTLLPATLSSPVPSLRVRTVVALTLTGGAAIVTLGVTAGSSPVTVMASRIFRSAGVLTGLWAGSVGAAVVADAVGESAEPQAARAGTSTREVRTAAMAAREERTREGPSEGDRGPATVTAAPVAPDHRPQPAHSGVTCCR